MRIIPEKQKYNLTAASVDSVSEDLKGFLNSLGMQRKNLLAVRIAAEEIMLALREHFGEDTEFTYTKNSFWGKPYVAISVDGEEFNPLEKEADDLFGDHTNALFQSIDSVPLYTYEHGINVITMKFSKKELNPIVKLLFAVIAALLISLIKFLLPEGAIDFVRDDVLTPVNNTFIGMMVTVELPLVFFSVTSGILGVGNSSIFGRIGRTMVLYLIRIVFLITAVSGLVIAVLFNLSMGGEERIKLHGGLEMLLGIIPKSLIEPFTSDNPMQIVLMAVVIGCTLVILGDRVKTLSRLNFEANALMIHITDIISKFVPFFIFFVILNLIWSNELHVILSMWKPYLTFTVLLIVIHLFMLAIVSMRESVSFITLFKKILPTFLIGLGTASSTALSGECADCLTKRLGINSRLVEFGHPIGYVIFMPYTAVNFLVCAFYMAHYYKVQVSLLWLVIGVLLCAFVAIATPPVPGGAIAAYTVIFTQLGLPHQAIAIMISTDILFDFLATAFDSTILQLAMVRLADKTGMLDFETLRRPVSLRKGKLK